MCIRDRSDSFAPAVDFFVRFVSGRFGWSEHSEGRTPYRFVVTRAFVCNSGSVSGAQENRSLDRRVSLPERETLFFWGGLTAASALAASGLAVAAADLQSRFAGCVGVVSPPEAMQCIAEPRYVRGVIVVFYPCTNTKIVRSAVLLRRAPAGEAGFGVWSCRAGDAMRMIPGFRTSGLSGRCRSGKRRMKPGKFCKSRRIC